jgi:DNA-binding transcriptional LysR family regulator
MADTVLTVCPHPTCSKRHDVEQFACRQHWYSLPADIRRRITEHWRRRRLWPNAENISNHEAAKEAAHDFWRLRP